MSLKGPSHSKVGAGKSIVNRHERFFSRGTLMFIEGESSTEMFIVRSGCVRILKQEGENTIELARLGAGSVLGELSLLDHQPRSATAQVLEDTTVTVIDEELFTRTLQRIPDWLGNMVRLVVKRLRDTMKKTSDDIVRKSVGGVIQIILLLSETKSLNGKKEHELLVSAVKDQVTALIGLGGVEVENIFLYLILKEFIFIRKNDLGQEFIVIKEREVLRLYMQYLRMHQRGGTLIGESFAAGTFALIDVLLEAGKRNGTVLAGNVVRLEEQQIEIELERRGKERFIDRDAIDQLTEAKLLAVQENRSVANQGHHMKNSLLFNPDILCNVALLKTWLVIFKEEIRF